MRLGNNDYRDEDCGDDDCGDDASRVVRASGDADALVRGRFGTNRLTMLRLGDDAGGVPMSPWAKWGASLASSFISSALSACGVPISPWT